MFIAVGFVMNIQHVTRLLIQDNLKTSVYTGVRKAP